MLVWCILPQIILNILLHHFSLVKLHKMAIVVVWQLTMLTIFSLANKTSNRTLHRLCRHGYIWHISLNSLELVRAKAKGCLKPVELKVFKNDS